jgi:eukaryotic-like serine/threonine-protein kinase
MASPHPSQFIGPSFVESPAPPDYSPRPWRPSTGDRGVSSALPPDLLQQVRGRVRLLAALLFIAFAFDPLVYLVIGITLVATGRDLPAGSLTKGYFQLVYLAAAGASAALWRAARNSRLSASRLHTIGLTYEVAICFVIALTSTWEYYLATQMVPNMDWVPAVVILFPLVLPGPPRRMLAAAALAAAMSPLSILLLELAGQITATADNYVSATAHAIFAVGFAYMGARVVYGLGREVVRARQLGSYQLGELLGRGGMGEVYRATHRMLARPAAIKLIRPEMLGAGDPVAAELAIRRFRREAEVAASLRSPHTVELYDFGVTADRTFYFVMELLDGIDLESLVRQKGPLPAGRVIYLLGQVCESLEEAHARGLVHRDIKPANIHVGRLGLRHDFVKVLDFGLVKSADGESPDHSLATGTGQVAGTPAYMAPEVILGEVFDGRADLYALGCVAYYLLTGRLVFEVANPLGMMASHMRDAPVPPSLRGEMRIPPELERVVMQCLAKRPADRPAGAGELAQWLTSIDTAPWGEEQAMHWWKANLPA